MSQTYDFSHDANFSKLSNTQFDSTFDLLESSAASSSTFFNKTHLSQQFKRTNKNSYLSTDEVKEQINQPNINQKVLCDRCQYCQRWISKQTELLLIFEQNLIRKEHDLQVIFQQIKINLQQKTKEITDKNMLILQLQDNMKLQKQKNIELHEQLSKIKCQFKQFTQLKKQIKTPNKTGIFNNSQNHCLNLSLTDKYNGLKTSTIAPKSDHNIFEETLKKDLKQNLQKRKTMKQVEKYIFENELLKEYNSTLQQKLRVSKYKKTY